MVLDASMKQVLLEKIDAKVSGPKPSHRKDLRLYPYSTSNRNYFHKSTLPLTLPLLFPYPTLTLPHPHLFSRYWRVLWVVTMPVLFPHRCIWTLLLTKTCIRFWRNDDESNAKASYDSKEQEPVPVFNQSLHYIYVRNVPHYQLSIQ